MKKVGKPRARSKEGVRKTNKIPATVAYIVSMCQIQVDILWRSVVQIPLEAIDGEFSESNGKYIPLL